MPVSSRLARKMPSIRPTVGKFCTPEKPRSISRCRNSSGIMNGSVPFTPASTGVCLHHRQHLVRHLADDLVGVAVGEQAGERAAPGHAVAARVVDDDQVDAAGLLALGRQAGAGAAADDRPARGDLGAEALRAASGERCGAWAWRPGRQARRALGARRDLAPGGDQRVGEGLVVDVQRQADAACGRGRRESAARSCSNSARSASGSWKGWPGRSIAETPPSGIRKRTGPAHRVELGGDELADRAAFVGRGAHQRHRRVVAVEPAALEALGHRVPGAEVHHVERAARADVGQRRGARTRRAGSARPTARRRRSRRRSRWWRRRSRRRAGPSRPAFPSTGRRRRWRGRPGSRSRRRGAWSPPARRAW